jgi:RND family efflux transporter MFP subunit
MTENHDAPNDGHAQTTTSPEQKKREHEQRRLHPPQRSMAIWLPIVICAFLALFLVIGIWRHVHERNEQREFAKQNAEVSVTVVEAKRDTKPKDLHLPANIQAFQDTTVYPRANGYVRKWLVDIGDKVSEGQPLAEIETPELDQQVAQAKANYDIAKVTADRWRDLVAKKVVAAQDYDEKQAAAEAAHAQLEQLQKTQGFEHVTAPFAGRISARRVDVGALVSPTTPLFSLVQSDPLRVYVFVPQTNAPQMREGLPAKLNVQEYPGRDFDGTITNVAGAVDPTSRTLQVEVQVPNPDGTLYAGTYGEIKFVLINENAPIVLPSNAFVFRTAGPQVALVGDGDKIHWQNVQVGRDYGQTIEITNGVPEHARVVTNPSDDLQEGLHVQVKKDQSKPASSPAAAN